MADKPDLHTLAHYGVRGMRWGVRKDRGGRRKTSADYDEVAPLKKKKVHELSNAELKKLTERMQLEQNLAGLRAKQGGGSKLRQGKKRVDEALDYINTGQRVYRAANNPAVRKVGSIIMEELRR